MRPNFALDFRDSGIALLHRSPDGWRELGMVEMDAPDMAGALEDLRATALDLEARDPGGRGFATKLIIPNSQILYLAVEVSGDPETRLAEIGAALEGRTPYTLEELIYDVSGDAAGEGTDLQLAVIARETLAEAQDFAMQYRMNPVCFAAIPPEDQFAGEVWFGPSGLASSWLEAGEKLERDAVPVQVAAYGLPPEPEAETEADADPAAADEIIAEAAESPSRPDTLDAIATMIDGVPPAAQSELSFDAAPAEAEVAEAVATAAPISPPTPPESEPTPVEVPPAEVPPEDPAPQPLPEPDPLHDPEPLPEPDPLPPAFDPTPDSASDGEVADQEDAEAAILADAAEEAADDQPRLTISGVSPLATGIAAAAAADVVSAAVPAQEEVVEEAPMAVDVPLDDYPPKRRDLEDEGDPDGLSATEVKAADLAASLRSGDSRDPRGAAASQHSAPGGARRDPYPPLIRNPSAAPAAAPAAQTPAAAGPLRAPVKILASTPDTTRARGKDTGARVTAPTIPGSGRRKAGKGQPAPAKPTVKPTGAIAGITQSMAARAMAQSMAPQPLNAQADAAQPAGSAAGGAAFGFKPRAMPTRGKPRYLGLILTAILLLLLALVAGWSTYAIAMRDRSPSEPSAPSAQASLSAAPTDAAAGDAGGDAGVEPSPDDEMLADLQDPDDFAPANTAPATAAADQAPQSAPSPAATAVAATGTGIAPAATPAPGPQDEIVLATPDAPPAPAGVQGVTSPASTNDTAPSLVAAPPPFGTVYQFDDQGRVLATPEGIITPDGVTLIAGKPKLLPPDRPAAVLAAAAALQAPAASATAPAATDPAATPAAAPASTATANTVPADPALAGARPKTRPEDLTPPEAAVQTPADENASTAGQASSIRPQSRPKSVLAAGESARNASQSASLASPAALAAADLPPGALEISRRPSPRPRDLSRAVEAAVAAAVRQAPAPAAEQQVALAAAPVAAAPAAKPAAAAQAPSRSEIEADDEPEDTRPAPKIPVKASVAKQATMTKAINLSKINLIGVYGSNSNRYALVRQSNGKYTKVKVGDSLDGGRIAAITTSEVRYQKGSRMLTLEMPKG